MNGGCTSLASPLVAAFQAITGVNGSTPQWAYADAANLNDPSTGSTGACSGQLSMLCNAAAGYDGPTGAGSISGQIATGAPGGFAPSTQAPSTAAEPATHCPFSHAGRQPRGRSRWTTLVLERCAATRAQV